MSVQTTLIHMLSRMPRKTMPPRIRRKPTAMTVGGNASRPVISARIAAKIFDCVATDVRPEATSASPIVKLKTGMPKARSVT